MDFDKYWHGLIMLGINYGLIRISLRILGTIATGILIHLASKLGEDAVLHYLKTHGLKKGI